MLAPLARRSQLVCRAETYKVRGKAVRLPTGVPGSQASRAALCCLAAAQQFPACQHCRCPPPLPPTPTPALPLALVKPLQVTFKYPDGDEKIIDCPGESTR